MIDLTNEAKLYLKEAAGGLAAVSSATRPACRDTVFGASLLVAALCALLMPSDSGIHGKTPDHSLRGPTGGAALAAHAHPLSGVNAPGAAAPRRTAPNLGRGPSFEGRLVRPDLTPVDLLAPRTTRSPEKFRRIVLMPDDRFGSGPFPAVERTTSVMLVAFPWSRTIGFDAATPAHTGRPPAADSSINPRLRRDPARRPRGARRYTNDRAVPPRSGKPTACGGKDESHLMTRGTEPMATKNQSNKPASKPNHTAKTQGQAAEPKTLSRRPTRPKQATEHAAKQPRRESRMPDQENTIKPIDALIRELDSATGEALHGAIRELGGHGAEAQTAVEPLLHLIRYHDDEMAAIGALMAVGRIDPSRHGAASCRADVGNMDRSGRNLANMLNEETAFYVVAGLLSSPIGTLPPDIHRYPDRARAIWAIPIARTFPGVIPLLAHALTTPNLLGDYLTMVLGQVGSDNPSVARQLERLFDHDTKSVRDAALACAAMTGRMSVEELPRLIRAAHEDDSQFGYALATMAGAYPREVVAALVATLGADGLYLLYGVNALGRTAQEALVEELIPLLDSPDAAIRRVTAECLKLFGSMALAAMPRLRQLLGDDDANVRDAARVTMACIE